MGEELPEIIFVVSAHTPRVGDLGELHIEPGSVRLNVAAGNTTHGVDQ
jgi:hypothetical protein